MANPQVVVDFISNTSGLTSGFRSAEAGAGGFGSRLKSLGKAAAAGVAAAGVAALTYTLKTGIDEFEQAAKVTAQTNAVIKSTGGVANVTTKQVQELATALMKKSGVDDEVIQSGENMLLTFRNIHNEAGRGNDVFTQATKTMLDMSVALGKDVPSSAMILGKALNDPVKGMAALRRVGVTFDADQQKRIKGFVESGHAMEAQKIILKELNAEFGGSAAAAGKTLPGQLQILKQEFNNFAGDLVAKVIPAVQVVISWLRDHWPEIVGALQAAWGIIGPLVIAIGNLFVGVVKLIADNWSTIGPIVGGVVSVIQTAAGIVVAIVKTVTAVLNGDWANAWKYAQQIVSGYVSLIQNIVTMGFNVVKSVVTVAWQLITAATSAAWAGIRALVSVAVGALSSVISGAFNAIRGLIDGAWNAVKSGTSAAWGFVTSKVSDAVNAVKSTVSSVATWLSGFASGVWSAAVHKVGAVFDAIGDAASAVKNRVVGIFNDLVGFINGIIGAVGHAASGIANAIKGPINAVLSAWNSISLHVPSINIPSVKILGHKIGGGTFGGWTIGFPHVPLLAQGGVIDQPTLAVVGEAGREIVTPEALLRDIVGQSRQEIHVYIGDRELSELVRTEVVDVNTGIARTLLAGAA